MKKILCVHAHSSNINYLEKLIDLSRFDPEHLVIDALDNDEKLSQKTLEHLISEKIKIDTVAIIITCTVYSNLFQKKAMNKIPVLKIEDPLIKELLLDMQKKVLFFSNPQTVDLTMKKIQHLYEEQNRPIDYEVVIIPDVFELILSNQKIAYKKELTDYINQFIEIDTRACYLMQLSMSIVEEKYFSLDGQKINTVYGSAQVAYHSYFEKM